MYMDEYERWLAQELDDADLRPELLSIQGLEEEIKDRFAVELSFGTAGLRGVLGAGTNRMNVYMVRKATQGLANYLLRTPGEKSVAISYDSRIKSDVFAREAACVLAANGVKAWIYKELMPVPALSFATRFLKCDAGIMVTASHNPAKYNGYKAYGPDGCQMTEEAAGAVYEEMQSTDIFTGVKRADFDEALAQGKIAYIGQDVVDALYAAIEACAVRPGICKTAGLKLVYSPLNGSGNVPVRHVLADIGITDVTVVPEQEHPDGNFPTCPYPNPEIREALALGLALAEQTGADLMLATDPDADRVGIAVRTAMPTRSASGSVASIRSAPVCSARARPRASASRISGLGYGQVGKLPSGCSCSGTTVTSVMPMSASTWRTGTLPEPFRGEYTSFSPAVLQMPGRTAHASMAAYSASTTSCPM